MFDRDGCRQYLKLYKNYENETEYIMYLFPVSVYEENNV